MQYNLGRQNKLAHLESTPFSLDMVKQQGGSEGARKAISSKFYKILTKHYPDQRLSYNILRIWQKVREIPLSFFQVFWPNKISLRIFLKYPKYSHHKTARRSKIHSFIYLIVQQIFIMKMQKLFIKEARIGQSLYYAQMGYARFHAPPVGA